MFADDCGRDERSERYVHGLGMHAKLRSRIERPAIRQPNNFPTGSSVSPIALAAIWSARCGSGGRRADNLTPSIIDGRATPWSSPWRDCRRSTQVVLDSRVPDSTRRLDAGSDKCCSPGCNKETNPAVSRQWPSQSRIQQPERVVSGRRRVCLTPCVVSIYQHHSAGVRATTPSDPWLRFQPTRPSFEFRKAPVPDLLFASCSLHSRNSSWPTQGGATCAACAATS